MIYAVVITAITEVLYYVTHYHIAMESIHIEVLLPAFILGAVIQVEHDDTNHQADHQDEAAPKEAEHELEHLQDQKVHTVISAVFMVFVGLSMPPLFGDAEDGSEGE